jgi:hypothetical protein
MAVMLRRRRNARKALKLARLLAAIDAAAEGTRPAERAAGRLSFGRA